MTPRSDPRPRARSPFAAAFLSFLFPGLGHAYAGAHERAIGFAAAPLLITALTLGLVFRDRLAAAGFFLQPGILLLVLVLNVVAFGYRLVAIVDAYRVTMVMNAWEAAGRGRLGPPRTRFRPLSVAGLLAVVLVMGGGHAALAYYDLQAYELVTGVFDPGDPTEPPPAEESPGAVPTLSPGAEPSDGGPTPAPTQIPEWNEKDRLNILLIGADTQGGGHNTDTLITVSIDPITKQVAMFSLPRDTVDVPLPAGLPARSVYGRVYGGKINSLYAAARRNDRLFPDGGYGTLKRALGELYELDIRYFVEVDFEGFRKTVDALGGVTVNVQIPVIDDRYPAPKGHLRRVYIPTGIQHMTGAEALVYARSRKGSTDFDRAQRQQRILLSLRQQADVATLIGRLPELVDALRETVRTDLPADKLPQLAQLAGAIDPTTIRSFVFVPSTYQREVSSGDPRGYVLIPRVDRIRAAVRNAFRSDPEAENRRQAIAEEGGTAWVLNGAGDAGQAASIAAFLDANGLLASAPTRRPDEIDRDRPATKITVYNGAEARLARTLELLAEVFEVEPVLAADPAVPVDVVIITGGSTPTLTPPPAF